MKTLDKYFAYIENEMNFSAHTIKKYEHVLNDVESYSQLLDVKIENLTSNQLKNYVMQLIEKKYAKTTQAQTISIIKSFYKYLLREGFIDKNPSKALVYPKPDQKLPKVLYESELRALFDSIDTKEKFGKRNLAILIVLYSSGIRCSELEQLKVSQFNNYSNNMQVVGKGNKERIVPLNRYTYDVVMDYILFERDSLLKGNKHDNLWINNRGMPLTTRGIRYIIDKVVDESAVMIKISPHTLRHSFASHLLSAGMDVRMVQELLGHESLSTTEIYTHLDSKTLGEKYRSLDIRR